MYVIFMYVHKTYESLDNSRCLEITEGYSAGPRVCHLLWKNWSRLRMVANTGLYYRATFRGARGMTKGDSLSPTISNVVVDTVV